VASRPHDLSDELRVPGNSNNSGLPKVEGWFLDSSNFLEVEDRRIEEEETQKVEGPSHGMSGRILSEIIKLNPIVSVGDKVGDPTVGKAQ